MRFIEYMPFDGNKWNAEKMVPYKELLEMICGRWPHFYKAADHSSDTSKVAIVITVWM